MQRKTKVWLTVAAALTLIGGIVFTGGMAMLGWNFAGLSTTRYETSVYEIEDTYTSLSILSDTADVVVLPSEDGKTKVECVEEKNRLHAVAVKDGTLTVELKDTRKWYEHISIGSIGFHTKLTVFLPRGAYNALSVKVSTGDVEVKAGFAFDSIDLAATTGALTCSAEATGAFKMKTSTGDIYAKGIKAGAVDLVATTGRIELDGAVCGALSVHVSTGRVDLRDVACESLVSSGSTGRISLERVIATGRVSVKRDTGDVAMSACDASELVIKTTTGTVSGTLLSEKIFLAKTSTGSVEVPSTSSGGRCEVTTTTGDIRLSIGN